MDIKEPREDRRREPIPGEYGFPIPKELLFRELGFGGFTGFHNFPRNHGGKKIVSQSLATKAVHTLCTKDLSRRRFKLPNGARTTFHIAFSADGTKVASCHGDHNVYVCDVASGEVMQTLTGHPRTPWCVVFHPTQNDVLASGCLAGHVRVWDLKGGSELLITDSGTVIASLAFHPTVRLLAVATFNEIIFWDWGHPYPMARCSTENTKEKVRLVRFDRLGRNLITGITNFPSPPAQEEVRKTVRGSGVPFYRPNILSRTQRRLQTTPVYPRSHQESRTIDQETFDEMPVAGVVEEVVVPDSEETEAEAFAVAAAAVAADEDPLITLNARQDRFQESYRQLVSHYEELVSNYQQFLRSRIPRILENTDLTPNPREQPQSSGALVEEPLLQPVNSEVELSQIEERFQSDHAENSSPENEVSEPEGGTVVLEPPASPSPTLDDEVPGPSRLLFESNVERAGLETPNLLGANWTPGASTSGIEETAGTSSGATTGTRSDTDLRSIEALAQNILEMQNLCSQVRMDAPLAVENQHIMELRIIRRHLELLQEQTRDLQSSIRATLNSLATGSLAALRSHVANTAAAAAAASSNSNNTQESPEHVPSPFINLPPVTPPTPLGPGPVMDFEIPSPSPPASPTRSIPNNVEDHVPSNEEMVARRARQFFPSSSSSSRAASIIPNPNPNAAGPNTLYRIMIATPFTESSRLPNTSLFNRIRVPPMVAMQYELPDAFARAQAAAARHLEEPVAGPSTRDANPTPPAPAPAPGMLGANPVNPTRGRDASPGGNAPRRIVREFHLVSGRPGAFVAEEHARHCPFSGRDPYQWRPPPRMRSLYDMGEMPPLITWPTMETGMEASIRNFREVALPVANNRPVRNPLSSITITVRNGFGGIYGHSVHDNSHGGGGDATRNAPFMNFTQWLFASGVNSANLTSDILVGIYLSIRQFNGSTSNESSLQIEQWQQVFGNHVSGLAVIPPALRQGVRQPQQTSAHRCQHRRRRTHWICYNQNSNSQAQVSNRPPSIPASRNSSSSSSNPNNNNNNNQEEHNQSTSISSSSASASSRASPSVTHTFSNAGSSSESNSPAPPGSSIPTPPEQQPSGSKNVTSASISQGFKPGRTIPNQLARNFTRIFYIRAVDELIPVYTAVNSSAENVISNEVRESLQASVYYLPIGLFLQGGGWEGNTLTVGIHWPPVTRDEEYAILDLRASERPLSVYESDTRESYPNNRRYPRIRVDYDETSMRVTLPTGFSLHFIQSGLTLLDCISNSVNLSRPRAIQGTLWIDYLGPFLDALERMFGLRHTRRGFGALPPGHRVGTFLGRTPPWAHPGSPIRPPPHWSNNSNNNSPAAAAPPANSVAADSPRPPVAGTSTSSNSSSANTTTTNNNNNSAPASGRERPGSSRRADVGERLRTMSRRIITLAPDANADNARRRFYEENPMLLGHGYMYDTANSGSNNGGNRPVFERNTDRRFYFRQRHRQEYQNAPSSFQQVDGPREMPRDAPDGSRFIRLAVDTAASEVLRRNPSHLSEDAMVESSNGLPIVEAGSASGFSTLGRPVESRIERVLNERGNRGAHSPLLDDPRNRMRLEDIQMRISMLSQWSRARAMSSSGTQTTLSFFRNSWGNGERPPHSSSLNANSINHDRERSRSNERQASSTATSPSANNSTPASSSGLSDPRLSRRRPYSRMARTLPNEADDTSDDDVLVSLPPRIPRLNDPSSSDYDRLRPDRSDPATPSSRESSRQPNSRQSADHQWILRSVPASTPHRFRPANMMELSGSARTRAPPQNRFSAEGSDQGSTEANNEREIQRTRLRVFTQRPGPVSLSPASAGSANNDGNNNNVANGGAGDEQFQDPGARFYPGYIPEILITPRTRPPTYYTMDAATTAFLSSRIQKWDFSEFLIPDITKREEYVVVRECSLHSDACLDVSSDSEFLAVLQPSDGGSYSSVGLYSLRDDSLGEILSVYHFDQNTVSVSISPSCDYLVVGYAGRGPLYRFVHPSRGIGKILSLTRDEEGCRLVHVKDLFADGQVAFMSINCMHWVPVAGYGIVYGTNTGDLVLLS